MLAVAYSGTRAAYAGRQLVFARRQRARSEEAPGEGGQPQQRTGTEKRGMRAPQQCRRREEEPRESAEEGAMRYEVGRR